MKRTFTFLATMLLCIGVGAQTEATRMTADQLNAVTEKLPIAIQCTQESSYNTYYNGSGRTATKSNDIIFYWVPVVAGEAGTYYIMKGDGEEDYLQTTNIITFGTVDAAAKFHAVMPYNGGKGINGFAGANCYYNNTDAERAAWVRLALSDNSKWFNFNGNAYNTATGVWTVQFVHDMTGVDYTPVTVTYKFMYGGELVATQTTTTVKDSEYPDYTVALPYGFVAAAKPQGTVGADETVEVLLTQEEELPFEYAASYEEIEHWYYMNIRDDEPTYMVYEAGVDYIKATQSSLPTDDESTTEIDERDAYAWAFVGDPINGFQIVNYAAGESMVLSAPVAPTENKNAAQLARMVDKGSATGNTVWTIIKPTHTNKTPAPVAGAFYVQHPTATVYAFNRQDYDHDSNSQTATIKTVCYWNQRDTGSDLQVVERPVGPAAELAALVEEIEAMGITSGTNIGDYTATSVTALNDAVTAAKAVETATAEDVTTLQTALDDLRIVLPDPNKFYYFDCVYQDAETDEIRRKLHINSNNQLNWVSTQADFDAAGSRAIFQFEAGATPNTVKIKSVHTQSYMGEILSGKGGITFGETGADITIARSTSNAVADELKPYAVMFIAGNNLGIHANMNPVGGWTNGAGSNHYVLTEVAEFKHTLTIDEYDYMTLILGFNATVPEGVTAYKVTGVGENNELTMTSVGTVIPAGEPVIVYTDVAEGQTKTTDFAYTATAATKSNDNLLEGTLVDNSTLAPTAGKDAYVMGLSGTNVVMGKATLTDGVFRNRANKAYLELETAVAGAAMYSFGRGEGTTGIETTVNGEQTTVIYDLTGRRVAKMEKGVYIVNGRKVVIK